MANNINITDSSSAVKTINTTDNAGVHTPAHQIVASDGTVVFGTQADTAATSDTGSFTMMSFVKRLLGNDTTALATISTTTTWQGTVITALNNIVSGLRATRLDNGTNDIGNVVIKQNGNVLATGNGLPTSRTQSTVTQSTVTLTAGNATDLMIGDATRNGGRILNWTTSPIYFVKGTSGSGTPVSGAPSDYCPAISSGEPGQYTFDFRPVDTYRVVGATAGNLTLIIW